MRVEVTRLARFAIITLLWSLSNASAGTLIWPNGTPVDAHYVWRVSGCAEPKYAMRLNRPMRCTPTSQAWLEAPHIDGSVPKVLLSPCGDSVRPPSDLSNYIKESAGARPEWDTVPVADGPGMSGISSVYCDHAWNDATTLRPHRDAIASIAVLRGATKGTTSGTGSLIGRSLLLTAWHVACNSKKTSAGYPVIAVFPNRRRLTSFVLVRPHLQGFEDEEDFDIVKLTDFSPRIVVGSEDLDYAVLLLERRTNTNAKAKVTHPGDLGYRSLARLVSRDPPAFGGGANVVGFTDNVYFPRGMIWSTGGKFLSKPTNFDVGNHDLFHNSSSAPGFSGGPIFDNAFLLRGIQLIAFANVSERNTDRVMQYDKPMGGLAIETIWHDIQKRAAGTNTSIATLDDLEAYSNRQVHNPLERTCSK